MIRRGIICGFMALGLAGCSAGREVLNSVPLIGSSTPSSTATQTLNLEGALLTISLEGWLETDRQKSIEGTLYTYKRSGVSLGNLETLDIQALRAHADNPVETFANSLQNNIREVCKDPSLAPLTRRQMGDFQATILRFSCETKARARAHGGLRPYEAGLYAIVPTDNAMLVIQRAWSGAERGEDFPVLTLRPDWKEFLDNLLVSGPAPNT